MHLQKSFGIVRKYCVGKVVGMLLSNKVSHLFVGVFVFLPLSITVFMSVTVQIVQQKTAKHRKLEEY